MRPRPYEDASAYLLQLSGIVLRSEDYYAPDKKHEFNNCGYQCDRIKRPIDEGRDSRQDEQPEDNQYRCDVGSFVLHRHPTPVARGSCDDPS